MTSVRNRGLQLCCDSRYRLALYRKCRTWGRAEEDWSWRETMPSFVGGEGGVMEGCGEFGLEPTEGKWDVTRLTGLTGMMGGSDGRLVANLAPA